MITIEEKIYLSSSNDDTGIANNIISAYEIVGEIDIVRFRNAWNFIIRKHDSFRSSFELKDKKITKIIYDNIKYSIVVEDIGDESLRDVIIGYTKPIDLSKPPLFNVKILRKSKNTHYLLLNISHIIFDGFSSRLLIQEIVHYYDKNEIDDYSFDFKVDKAFIHKNESELEVAKTFWESKEIKKNRINFPFDGDRKEEHSNRGKILRKSIDAHFLEKLKETASIYGISTFKLLYSAYCILLSKYCNSNNILTGFVYSGRTKPNELNKIGVFANVIPTLSSPSQLMSFEFFVNETDNQVIESLKHFHYLNKSSVARIKPDFVFNYYISNTVKGKSFDIRMSEESILEPIENAVKTLFSIFFNLNYTENEIDYAYFNICYNMNFFSNRLAEQIYSSYKHLLNQIIENPKIQISKLSILPQKEYNKIVEIWNKTAVPFKREKSVVKIFESQVIKTPDNIAISFQNQSISYKALNARINKLANYITNKYKQHFGKEIKTDTLVGIYLERSLELIISIFAIIKSGAAYVPFDSQEKNDSLDFKLKDSSCDIIISSSKLALELERKSEHTAILLFDEESTEIEKQCDNNPKCITSGNNLAYVIYTSGSTGQPKGMMVEHTSLHNLILWQIKHCELDRNKKVLHFLSTNFDASVCEIFPTLCSGSTLIMADSIERKDIRKIIELIKSKGVNVASMPPSFLALVPKNVTLGLNTLRIGGEICDIETMQYWAKQHRLVNAYGPTEATVWSTYHIWQEGDINTNIGKPIPNQTAYILDATLNPLPIGINGELYVGGEGVGRAYLNSPELTNKRFIPNHLASDEDRTMGRNLRLYKTGDICRWLPNGDIDFVGRNDNQIKIRGFRVELDEIIKKLLTFENVEQCKVLYKNVRGIKMLVAYYISTEKIEQQKLKSHIKNLLPYYMVPSVFVYMEKFPLNPNGKLDNESLPEPKIINENNQYSAPRTEMENQICSLWKKIFKLYKISIYDNFFDLGGDSLTSLIFVNLLEENVGLHIPVNHVYKYNDLYSLADELTKNRNRYSSQESDKQANNMDDEDSIICLREGIGTPIYILIVPPQKPDSYKYLCESYKGNNPIYSVYMSENILTQNKLSNINEWYANRIENHKNTNKLILMGYCTGSFIAIQVAAILEKENNEIKVMVLDTSAFELLDFSRFSRIKMFYSDFLKSFYVLITKKGKRGRELKETFRLIKEFICKIIRFLTKWTTKIEKEKISTEDMIIKIRKSELKQLQVKNFIYNNFILSTRFDNSFNAKISMVKTINKDYIDYGQHSKYLYWDYIYPSNEIEISTITCDHSELIFPPYIEKICRILENFDSEKNTKTY